MANDDDGEDKTANFPQRPQSILGNELMDLRLNMDGLVQNNKPTDSLALAVLAYVGGWY